MLSGIVTESRRRARRGAPGEGLDRGGASVGRDRPSIADCPVRQTRQAMLAPRAGVVENVLDPSEALEGRSEEGHQVRDQQMIGNERAMAVLVRPAEGVEQVLQGLQHAPGDEILLTAGCPLRTRSDFASAARRAHGETRRARLRYLTST